MNPFQQFVDAQQRDDVKNEDVIYFWRVNEKFGEFSQWYKSSFVCDGDTFSTAEQYMMYKKAMIFGDTEIANRILDTPHLHPHEHKKMGRMITNFDPDRWESESMRVVVNGNFRKFTQNNDLMKMLMNTGNKEIVEASPTDRIWGIGFAASNATSNAMMWGQNKLGKCLMAVRSMILPLYPSGIPRDLSAYPAHADPGISKVIIPAIKGSYCLYLKPPIFLCYFTKMSRDH